MAHTASATSKSSFAISSSAGPTAITTSLLTRFTTPADCTTTWWQSPISESAQTTSQTGALITADFDVDMGRKSCMLEKLSLSAGRYYPVVYSPGVCPDGYTPATSLVGLFVQATTSLCCHKNLTYLTSGHNKGYCGGIMTSRDMTITLANGRGTVMTGSTVVDSFYAIDVPYTVAWKYPELSLYTPSGLPLLVANQTSNVAVGSLTTPLLTRFTPPADCKTTWWELSDLVTGIRPTHTRSVLTAAVDSYPTSSCELPQVVPTLGSNFKGLPVVYSPGVCGAGYTPASTITIGEFGQATTSLCCREGLTILSAGRWAGNCGSTITNSGITIFQVAQGGVTTSTVVNSVFAVDLPYTAAWASSDLPLFTPSGLPLIIAKESKPKHSASSVHHTPMTSSSHLSAGAQAGIGVGAAVVGVAIGALLMWFFFIRRRFRRRDRLLELEGKVKDLDDGPGIPELGIEGGRSEVAAKEKAVEMYANVGHEFPSDWGQEVDAGMRHELDGNYKGEELTDINTPVDGESPTWIEVIEKLRPINHPD